MYFDPLLDTVIIDFNACNFTININESDTTKGRYSGTFYGILKNGSNLNDSIILSGGKFNINLSDQFSIICNKYGYQKNQPIT